MISFICASRGRPMMAREMAMTIQQQTCSPFEVLLGLDESDPRAAEYGEPAGVRIVQYPGRLTPHQKWNELAVIARGQWIVQVCDGLRIRTHAWDAKVRRSTQRGAAWVCRFSDGYRNMAQAMSREFLEQLDNQLIDPALFCNYGDEWILDVARRAGCLHELYDIDFEHLTPDNGKIASDESHKWIHRDGNRYVECDRLYYEANGAKREKQAEWVRGFNARQRGACGPDTVA